MKTILILLMVVCFDDLYAQPTLKIEYKQTFTSEAINSTLRDGSTSIFITDSALFNLRMLINDTIAHVHHFKNMYEPFRKRKKTFGKKNVPHGYFLDFKNNQYFSEVDLPKMPKHMVDIGCSRKYSWVISKVAEKKVLGYNCFSALSINDVGDSTLVFFTNELKFKKGCLYYIGISGIVLEAYSQNKSTVLHQLANNIDFINVELVSPNCKNIFTCEKSTALFKKRMQKMEGNSFYVRKY